MNIDFSVPVLPGGGDVPGYLREYNSEHEMQEKFEQEQHGGIMKMND